MSTSVLRGSSLKGVVFSCHRCKVNRHRGGKKTFEVVSEAKTPFLSFLDDGGSEKKYERVRFGRESFQKKSEVGKNVFLGRFCSKFWSKMYSIKLHFPTSNLFLKIFSTEPDPLVFFFETAVVQKAQKRGLSFRDNFECHFTPPLYRFTLPL